MPSYFQKVTLETGFIIQRMTSIVVFGNPPERAASLAGDSAAAGLTGLQSLGVLADVALAVQLHRPDVLVCHVVKADEAFFSVTRQLGAWAAEGVEAKIGPSEAKFLTISPPRIWIFGKKLAKNRPLRSICSRRPFYRPGS